VLPVFEQALAEQLIKPWQQFLSRRASRDQKSLIIGALAGVAARGQRRIVYHSGEQNNPLITYSD
jgi:hypothetical protein